MKKLESSITNMVVVLVAVAVVTGGLLAWVNDVTSGPIAEQNEKTLADGIKAVMGNGDIEVTANDSITKEMGGKECTFVVHKTADASGNFIGAAVESAVGGFGGDLKVLVGFDGEGKVLGYTILQTAETPGLGAKADKWFQKDGRGSIIGKNPDSDDLTVKKDGGSVDAITASTITSRAFLLAVNQAYNAYKGTMTDAETSATEQNDEDGTTSASQQHHEEQ